MRKCSIAYEQRAEKIKCMFRTYASRYAYESALAYINGSYSKGYITYQIYSNLKAIALNEYQKRQRID